MGYSIETQQEGSGRLYFSVGNKKGINDEETEKLKSHCLWAVSKESLKIKDAVELVDGKGWHYTSLEKGKIEGMLKSIKLEERVGGKQGKFYMWEITLFDDKQEMVISGDLESSYIEDFIKRIGNNKINFDLPLIIKAYNIKDKDYWNPKMCIYQKDAEGKEIIVDRFYNAYKQLDEHKRPVLDKEGKPIWVSVNGFPLLEFKEVTDYLTGKVTIEFNNRKRLAFMNKVAKEVTEKLENARLKKAEEQRAKQPQIVPTTELPTYDDDLPF